MINILLFLLELIATFHHDSDGKGAVEPIL